MSITTTRAERRQLARDNAKLPTYLEGVPRDDWPEQFRSSPRAPFAVWRSRHFLVQSYREEGPAEWRLSILRTTLAGDRWRDGITWDELQQIKREVGFGDRDAVEVYPADRDVVNVANIRHLWIMREAVPFAWRKEA